MTLAKRNSRSDLYADAVAAKVMETSPLIMRFIRRQMKEREGQTSVPQVRVMAFIEGNPGCSLTSLSDSMGITSASASAMIERLVRAGLVDRVIDPLKRRNVILHLTPGGATELGGARQLAVQAISGQLAKLDDTQLKHVEESMTLLRAIFGTVYGDLDTLSEHAYTAGETSAQWKRGPIEP